MKSNEKKMFLIFLSIGILFIPAMIFFPKKPDFYPISYKSPQYYFDELIHFILTNLRDSNSNAFLKYQLANGTYDEIGSRTYASFNIWGFFSFMEASRYKNNSLYREQYAIPALKYVINNLLNQTWFGVYHWCYKNGSFPPPAHLYFNDSQNIYSIYQAWMSLALLDLYQYSNNETYLNYANRTLNFLITRLWDPINYGFYYAYFPYDGTNSSEKVSWYQSWPLKALLKGYEVTNNQSYLFYINKTMDFMIDFLWDDTYGGFFSESDANGSNVNTDKYLSTQAGSIMAFLSAANILNNQSLISDYISPTLNFTKHYLWNDSVGQFYSQTNSSGGNPNNIIITSEISVMIDAILDYTEQINNFTYYNLTFRALDYLINNLWDVNSFGFYKKFDINSMSGVDFDKWTQEQVYPLIIFCKLSFNKIDILIIINIGLLFYFYNQLLYSNNLNNYLLPLSLFSITYGVILSIFFTYYFYKNTTIKKVEKEKNLILKKSLKLFENIFMIYKIDYF